MSLYTYECQKCGKIMDKVFPMESCPREIGCIHCRGVAKKIIAIGHGGIQEDGDVPWLSSACDVLQRPSEPRLTTRTEWKRYLKKEGLTPIG
jgi:putative FmdB family regulatory protein